ncbi:MAG TPA: hypothetical protein DCS30_18885 [Rhizobiales bacterium]|uniref:Uncharacterized protein n=1 Tax=Cohaesibacter gelatinilyticus TaxID=372072 RepID=A0A285NCC2_9HYPH|nr:hypothetical protein SAMN06265368_0660 [Cohaesibacter gelatinilyticus]HAT87813.1 hypothetical protein [Hyphomicrobiales bacterium]
MNVAFDSGVCLHAGGKHQENSEIKGPMIVRMDVPKQTSFPDLAKRVRIISCLTVFCLPLIAACTSSTGDLGRPEKPGIGEGVLSALGRQRARMNSELVSSFNATDEETEMRNKAWVLIYPPHATDWTSAGLRDFLPHNFSFGLHVFTEAQRLRLTPAIDEAFDSRMYYDILRAKNYLSHHTRYDRVIDDIEKDREALATFLPAARKVVEMDEHRMQALGRLADMRPGEMQGAYARVDENRRFIGWVWRALQNRMRAYAHAIKRLEVETPSHKVKDANFALKALYREVQEQNGALEAQTTMPDQTIRRSRLSRKQWAKENPNLVK